MLRTPFKENRNLVFSLTDAQENALNEILQDMKHPGHMNQVYYKVMLVLVRRLLLGLAMYATVIAGM